MVRIARYDRDGVVHHGLLEDKCLRRVAGGLFDDFTPTGEIDAIEQVRLLSPLSAPRVFGVGANYVAHIAEMGMATPSRPKRGSHITRPNWLWSSARPPGVCQ